MKELYVKNKEGDFIPIDINKVFGEDLAGHLVIVRVGTDANIASSSDLDATESTLLQADVLKKIRDISVLITPFQIEIDTVSEKEIGNKSVCVQITNGGDIGMLENKLQTLYNKIKNKFKTVVLPIPLSIEEYRKIKETLKRLEIKKERRRVKE